MENLIIVLVCIVLSMLDNSIVPFFKIHDVYPSLLFTFVIAYSIVNKKEKTVFVGIISGLLQDVFFPYGFGINCFTNVLLCLAASKFGESMMKEKKIISVMVMFIITVIKYLGIACILYFFNIKVQITRSLIMGIYNGVLMFFIYKYVYNIYDDEYTKQRWRFK